MKVITFELTDFQAQALLSFLASVSEDEARRVLPSPARVKALFRAERVLRRAMERAGA